MRSTHGGYAIFRHPLQHPLGKHRPEQDQEDR